MFKRKKINLQFPLQKKGYNIVEVDKYLANQKEANERFLQEQKLYFNELKEQNAKLKAEVDVYAEREEEIKKVLIAATEKADDMSTDLKLQYALEIERLKIFQAKWTNAYEEIKEKYHFDKDVLNMESVVANTALELERLLYKDFGIRLSSSGGEAEKQFKNELERLDIDQNELSGLINKLKAELKEVS